MARLILWNDARTRLRRLESWAVSTGIVIQRYAPN